MTEYATQRTVFNNQIDFACCAAFRDGLFLEWGRVLTDNEIRRARIGKIRMKGKA